MTDEEVIERNLAALKANIGPVRKRVFDLLGVTEDVSGTKHLDSLIPWTELRTPDDSNQLRIPLTNSFAVNDG